MTSWLHFAGFLLALGLGFAKTVASSPKTPPLAMRIVPGGCELSALGRSLASSSSSSNRTSEIFWGVLGIIFFILLVLVPCVVALLAYLEHRKDVVLLWSGIWRGYARMDQEKDAGDSAAGRVALAGLSAQPSPSRAVSRELRHAASVEAALDRASLRHPRHSGHSTGSLQSGSVRGDVLMPRPALITAATGAPSPSEIHEYPRGADIVPPIHGLSSTHGAPRHPPPRLSAKSSPRDSSADSTKAETTMRNGSPDRGRVHGPVGPRASAPVEEFGRIEPLGLPHHGSLQDMELSASSFSPGSNPGSNPGSPVSPTGPLPSTDTRQPQPHNHAHASPTSPSSQAHRPAPHPASGHQGPVHIVGAHAQQASKATSFGGLGRSPPLTSTSPPMGLTQGVGFEEAHEVSGARVGGPSLSENAEGPSLRRDMHSGGGGDDRREGAVVGGEGEDGSELGLGPRLSEWEGAPSPRLSWPAMGGS